MIDRRSMMTGAAAAAACSGLTGCSPPLTSAPNIVFLLADDLGWADLGCYGRDDLATPNIDSLARDGLRFTNAYANSSVCSPTRIALITGRYQHRFPPGQSEPISDAQTGLEPGIPTMPRLLKERGYQTSLVGKWHLGSALRFSPLKHGYDHFWGIRGGAVDYFTHEIRFAVDGHEDFIVHDLWEDDSPAEEIGYLTDLIGDRSVNELRRMGGGALPFLLSVHFTAPHWPWETPDDASMAVNVRDSRHFDGGSIAAYRRMVESLDLNVGKILSAIRRLRIGENTVVIFSSDNGGERFSKMWPFNGMKGELLEGGIRTPLLVRWPNRIAAGAESHQVAISMDWLPTFLAASGAGEEAIAPFDGMSLLPNLTRGEVQNRRLFWRHKAYGQEAVRDGRWKYLQIAGQEFLFDIEADPQERANLKSRETRVFDELKSAWRRWNSEMLPYADSDYSEDNKAPGHIPDRY